MSTYERNDQLSKDLEMHKNLFEARESILKKDLEMQKVLFETKIQS
jgi:hypothetical protein